MLHIEEIIYKKQWDSFLDANRKELYPFFQSWNWGEVLKSRNIPCERLGIFDNKKLIGVLLLVEVKAKRGHYLYLRHGPVLTPFSDHNFTFLLNYVKRIAKERNVSFIRISRLAKTNDLPLGFFTKLGFITCPLQTLDMEVCWILDITKSDEELLQGMRKTHRYLIKKAKNLSIEIMKSTDTSDLPSFISLYEELSQRKHFVPHKELTKEFEIFAKEGQEMLFLAKYNGEIIAGAIIAYIGNEAIYRHGAISERYRNIPASYLLQWEAILEAKKRNKKIYNFLGIAPNDDKNHPWYGHTLFKTGFGGEKEFFQPILDLPLRMTYWMNYAVDWISKIRKEL